MDLARWWRGSTVKAPEATSPNPVAARAVLFVRLLCARFDRVFPVATSATRFSTPRVGHLQHPRGMTKRQTQGIDLTDRLGQGSAP